MDDSTNSGSKLHLPLFETADGLDQCQPAKANRNVYEIAADLIAHAATFRNN